MYHSNASQKPMVLECFFIRGAAKGCIGVNPFSVSSSTCFDVDNLCLGGGGGWLHYQWRVGFCIPFYVLIIVFIIIQVADCTVDFNYVYMLLCYIVLNII